MASNEVRLSLIIGRAGLGHSCNYQRAEINLFLVPASLGRFDKSCK